ncbi:hypothetical protein ACFVMC_05060 [Nocardia sp. NPDC127579]|uniref:hypothetical protein n=1 Tax=Nocardia sp. NPDC127579 TaxID=3345402 RepID=UPI003641AD31
MVKLDSSGMVSGGAEHARRVIRSIAEERALIVVEVLAYRSDQQGWIFTLLETVHRFGIHAVVVADIEHVGRFTKAVTGVADLHSPAQSWPYSGYGVGYVRPSRARWVELDELHGDVTAALAAVRP